MSRSPPRSFSLTIAPPAGHDLPCVEKVYPGSDDHGQVRLRRLHSFHSSMLHHDARDLEQGDLRMVQLEHVTLPSTNFELINPVVLSTPNVTRRLIDLQNSIILGIESVGWGSAFRSSFVVGLNL